MDLWSDFQTYLQKLAMKILKRNKRGGGPNKSRGVYFAENFDF